MVTNLTEAQLLVNLTDTDGLFDKDPRRTTMQGSSRW